LWYCAKEIVIPVRNLYTSRVCCGVAGVGRREKGMNDEDGRREGMIRRTWERRRGGIVAEGMSYNLLGAEFSKIRLEDLYLMQNI
jgi:hypothetical protein